MSKHKSEVKLYVAASVMIYARAPVKHFVETKSNNMSKHYYTLLINVLPRVTAKFNLHGKRHQQFCPHLCQNTCQSMILNIHEDIQKSMNV
jgi:hypothetical protein